MANFICYCYESINWFERLATGSIRTSCQAVLVKSKHPGIWRGVIGSTAAPPCSLITSGVVFPAAFCDVKIENPGLAVQLPSLSSEYIDYIVIQIADSTKEI
jgi:hypothetical protein